MKITEKIYNGFVRFFGDLKIFRFPFFIIYDPGSYKVKGEDIREVIKDVQPGDILIRGYVNYLDGYIIPGFFSHAGLYIGKITNEMSAGLTEKQKKLFKTGDQMVIHSMAEGVFMEDVINFCRCDYMVILRRNPEIESQSCQEFSFEKIRSQALQKLGNEYDFQFNFSEGSKLSCTELVYVSCNGFVEDYNITVKKRRVLFMKKELLTPDDFVNSKLNMVWKSKSITDKHMAKIRKTAL